MPEHLTTQELAVMSARRLPAAELETAAAHLSACADCRARLNATHRTPARIAALRAALAVNEAAHEPEWRARAAAFWLPSRWLAAGASLLLLAAGWWWWRALPRQPAPPYTASVAPAPAKPVPTTPALPITPPATKLFLSLNDAGGQVTLDQAGRLSGLPGLPPAHAEVVRETLTKQGLALPPELKNARRAASALLGETEEAARLTLLAPVGTFIPADRPRLRWQPVTGARHYIVTVLDADFNRVAESAPLTASSWRPARALARNRFYVWQVTAQLDGRQITSNTATLPAASFKIISAAQARELQDTARRFGSAHLVLGTLYARAGLLDEATRELRLLLQANPDSELARRLLHQLSQR